MAWALARFHHMIPRRSAQWQRTTILQIALNKPDLLVIHYPAKKMYVLEMTCPAENRIAKKEIEKKEKYTTAQTDLSRICNSVHPLSRWSSRRNEGTYQNRAQKTRFWWKVGNPCNAADRKICNTGLFKDPEVSWSQLLVILKLASPIRLFLAEEMNEENHVGARNRKLRIHALPAK